MIAALKQRSRTLVAIIAIPVATVLLSASTAMADAPVLEAYPSQCSLPGVTFSGPAPELASGSSPVTYSLVQAPTGMTISSLSGVPFWETTSPGNYRIRIRVDNGEGYDIVEWILLVADDFSDQDIVRTKFTDFLVSPSIVDWMNQWHPRQLIDGGWMWLRNTIGQEPHSGRQMVLLDPGMGGSAVSGNPIRMGPDWWQDDPVHGWYLFNSVWMHEQAHNFHYLVHMPDHDYWPYFDAYIHNMCEFAQQGFNRAVLENPSEYGLSGTALANYQSFIQWLRNDYETRYQPYDSWLQSGGNAENYTGDTYGAWQKILFDLAEQYGSQLLRDTLLAYRPDGLSKAIRDSADTTQRRVTLLVAVLSASAGSDLRQAFSDWGFSLDDAYFTSIESQVALEMNDLPEPTFSKWRQSPINGHYYRLTVLDLHEDEAARRARADTGLLATIRSQAEMDWIKKTWGDRPFWIGLSDEGHEGSWAWMSGEPLSYTDWMDGEPNGGTGENYVSTNWWNLEGWIDVSQTYFFQGIVELNHPPAEVFKDDFEIGNTSFWSGGSRRPPG